MLKVQYGCGLSNPDGWRNYDSTPSLLVQKIPLVKLAARTAETLVGNKNHRLRLILHNIGNSRASYSNVVKGLPLKNGSVDLLYASHVLEHLPLHEFRAALAESLRVLKVGGVFRLVVPNLETMVSRYIDSNSPTKSIEFCLESGLGSESFPNPLSRLRGDSHWMMYDKTTLQNELRSAGFTLIEQAYLGSSRYSEFSEVEDPSRWSYPDNIGFECTK